jgi:chloride channel protein, CIC family
LSRRGLRVPSDYHADALRTTNVAEVMTKNVETVNATVPLVEVTRQFEANGHSAFPVLDDDGRCVGIVTRGDVLLEADRANGTPVGAVASHDVVSVSPKDTLSDALELMLEEEVEHLPVLDDGKLVGIFTRADILRARDAQRVHERTQPGWRPRRARS